MLERIVREHTDGLDSDRDKVVAVLTEAIPKLMKHPAMAPLGVACQADRDLNEEDLGFEMADPASRAGL